MKLIKKGIMTLCLLYSTIIHGFQITCYLKDKLVYHGEVDNVYFEKNYIALFVYKKNMAYYVIGNCLINDNLIK